MSSLILFVVLLKHEHFRFPRNFLFQSFLVWLFHFYLFAANCSECIKISCYQFFAKIWDLWISDNAREIKQGSAKYVCMYIWIHVYEIYISRQHCLRFMLQYKFIISMMLKLIITRLYAIKYQFNFVWSLRNCTKEDCMSLILWHELIKPCL